MNSRTERLILGTVNAPWKRQIDGKTLAALIVSGNPGDWLPHLATFFSEVRAALIWDFAKDHGITDDVILSSYRVVRDLSGEVNPDFEEASAPDVPR